MAFMCNTLLRFDESDSVAGDRYHPPCQLNVNRWSLFRSGSGLDELNRLPLRQSCVSNLVDDRPPQMNYVSKNIQKENKENFRLIKVYEEHPCFNTKVNHFALFPSAAGRSDAKKEDSYLRTDPALLSDIYVKMKEKESRTVPLFRKSEANLSIKMRSSLVDWFVFTAERFSLDNETLHLAVNYWDRYLFKVQVDVKDLLLVGTCAILLACKHEEARDNIPEMNKLVEHSSYHFSKRDIIKMEQNMLKELDFKLSVATVYQFLQIFACMLNIKGSKLFFAEYICDICLIHEEILFYNEPSKIAAASLALSNILFKVPPRIDEIAVLTAYPRNDLIITINSLFIKYDDLWDKEYKNVRAKYSSEKYKSVSGIIFPRTIDI